MDVIRQDGTALADTLEGMTIVDVSKAAGVSIATVSRVINGHTTVAPTTVAAVERAMALLGYIPPPAERRFRRNGRMKAGTGARHGNMALLFPDTHDVALRTPLSGRLMHGVNEVLASEGYGMLVTPLVEDDRLPPCIVNRKVDAVIVRGATQVSHVMASLRGHVCVWMLELPQPPEHGDQVLEDTTAIGRLAMRYLRDRGCRSVAAVNHMPSHPCYGPRIDAFAKAAAEAGMPADIFSDAVSVEALVGRAMNAWRAQSPADRGSPFGLFVPAPYEVVTTAYRALVAGGMKVGRDVHLIPCDYDPPRLAALDHGLPNIDIQPEVIARAAAEMLIWRMKHLRDPQRRLMIAPQLVEGEPLG